jgi:hypothetical protein
MFNVRCFHEIIWNFELHYLADTVDLITGNMHDIHSLGRNLNPSRRGVHYEI